MYRLGCLHSNLGVNGVPQIRSEILQSNEKKPNLPSMDNHTHDLNVPVAPTAATSSATRNKIALKPGRSLMDWIRLTHSGKDLAGTGGKCLEVSSRELAKHNTRKDAWISLRGKVYNITHYIDYHPGGEDELMRGAGRDATDLFNQVHQWVNAESMLQKCYVGILKKTWSFEVPKFTPIKNLKVKHKKPANASKELVTDAKSKKTISDSDSCNEPVNICDSANKDPIICLDNECSDVLDRVEDVQRTVFNKSEWSVVPSLESNPSEIALRFDEDGDYTKLIIKSLTIKHQGLITDLVDQRFFIKISDSPNYVLNIELPISFEDSFEVETQDEHSVEILLGILSKMKKHDSCQLAMKPPYPSAFRSICWTLCELKDELIYWSCKLVSRIPVNHNTFLFTYLLPPGTKMWIPIGRHVHIKSNVEGIEIVRSYTPVMLSLEDKTITTDGSKIVLMIKIYPKGVMTNLINQCKLGENMWISNYSGGFSEVLLTNCDFAIMLAAGTGITPMIRIIHWIITAKDKMRPMLLMFFNKTEEDILWKKELENCSAAYKNFDIIHVLSEPSENWSGVKGQLNKDLIGQLPTENLPDINHQIFICGPLPFTETALRVEQSMTEFDSIQLTDFKKFIDLIPQVFGNTQNHEFYSLSFPGGVPTAYNFFHIVDIQSYAEWKAKSGNVYLLDFYRIYLPKQMYYLSNYGMNMATI